MIDGLLPQVLSRCLNRSVIDSFKNNLKGQCLWLISKKNMRSNIAHFYIFQPLDKIYLLNRSVNYCLIFEIFWAGINSIKLKLSNLTYHIFVSILTFAVWSCLYIRICMLSPLLFPRRIVTRGKKPKWLGNFYLPGYNSACALCSVFIACLWTRACQFVSPVD